MPTDWYNSWVSRDVHGRDPASRLAMSCTMAKDFLGIAVSVVLALATIATLMQHFSSKLATEVSKSALVPTDL